MAEEPLQQILNEMRARIQAELDGQVQALQAREAEAIARARREAENDADERWSAQLQVARSEWAARLEAEIAEARSEADKRVQESTRLRNEAEVALADERERAAQLDAERREAEQQLEAERMRAQQVEAERLQLEQRLETERRRSDQQLEEERERAEQQLREARQRADEEKAAAKQESEHQLETERRRAEQDLQEAFAAFTAERAELEHEVAARTTAGIDRDAILSAMRGIDASRSLSEALTALARGSASVAPRVALFMVTGHRVEEWSAAGVASMSRQPLELDRAGLLRDAVARGSRVALSDAAGGSAPPFAALPQGRAAVAVPLMLGGRAVAVLYADEGVTNGGNDRHGWAESVELLARYGASCLAHLTAARSLQLLQGSDGGSHAGPADDEEQSARRYARLLVSEIKLYNEGAVRVGRERRDLLQRLRAEIDRARRLYEERVSPSVSARGSYFQQELVHTLAGGDPALLGS